MAHQYVQQTVHPPTGVSLSCRAHLTAPRDRNVVVVKANVLSVYRLSAAADALLLVGDWRMAGVPTSIAATRPPGAETDSLMLTCVAERHRVEERIWPRSRRRRFAQFAPPAALSAAAPARPRRSHGPAASPTPRCR